MKVLLYSGHQNWVEKSGVGRSIYHQRKALEESHIPYTTNLKEDFDIIHINTLFPSSLRISKKAKANGKKVVYHAHSTMEDFKNSFRGSNMMAPLFKKWIMKCYSSADLIITPTPYAKNLLTGYGLEKPIECISNGIDLSFFKKDIHGRKRFREKYHFGYEDKIIISVGLFIERKGIIDFVKLAKSMPEYQFIWFGYTNLNIVPSQVKEAVNTKLSNLHFPGYVSKEDLSDAYSGGDLFVFLTHEETEGIVLLEALAMKIPVLIRDIPIYKDWLTNGENSYKADSMAEFQKKIKGILSGSLPYLGENGYQVAQDRDIKKIGSQLKIVYQTLLD